MMAQKYWLLLLLPLALAAALGCESRPVSDPEKLSPATPYDADLPVPSRFEERVGSRYRRIPGEYREAQLVFGGRATTDAVTRFMLEQMVHAGWREESMHRRPLHTEIQFSRPAGLGTPAERSTVRVIAEGRRTRLELNVMSASRVP